MNTKIDLGTVVLGETIGQGGYGTVYKASVEPFTRAFAVKLLDPSPFHPDIEKALLRFVNEAEIMMTLRHDYVIPIYGVGIHGEKPYILMEYFDGFDLYKAVEVAGKPNPQKTLGFIEKVALALGHAHQHGIVHRDVKPSNLMTRKGDARVLDFGIAQIFDPDGVRFTQTGGTPVGDAFSSPELVDNPRTLDPRSDIYSLGACWFWLLTGTTPRGRNWEAELRSVDGMTPPMENVLLKTLDQVDKRYQSTDTLVIDIRNLISGSEPDASSEGNLEDDSALVLGKVFEHYIPNSEPVSVYILEQELSGKLNRFALSMAISTLRRMAFIESEDVQNFNESWTGLKVCSSGEVWIAKNRTRVELLLEEAKPEVIENIYDSEIPF